MKVRGRFSENWLEKHLGECLKSEGLVSFHMSAPSLPGIPDRYVPGCDGVWIEVKLASTRYGLEKGFERQRRVIQDLERAGDTVYVVALLAPTEKYQIPRLFAEPWVIWNRRELLPDDGWQTRNIPWQSPTVMSDMNVMRECLRFFARGLRR